MDPNSIQPQQPSEQPGVSPFNPGGAPPSAPVTPPAPVKNTRKTVFIIIGSIVGVLLLLFLIAILLTMFSGIQKRGKASAVAENFFKYSLAKDTTKLGTLYDDKGAKEFVEQAAAQVDKSCKVKSDSFKELATSPKNTAEIRGVCTSGVKDWKFGLEYSETKKDWVLTELVYNNGTPAAPQPTTKTPQPTTPTTPATLACIVPQDVTFFPNSALSQNVFSYFYEDALFFNADATSYQFPDQSQQRLALFADFYKKNSNKAFAYHLEGMVNEGAQSAAGKQLAQQRAELIKTELVGLGVPAERITIGEPQSLSNQYITEASRSVGISVKPDKNCGTAPTNAR